MLVGDFFDAMAGYNEGELERIKNIAEFIRISTTILINIQLQKGDKVKPQELWPFPWDKQEEDNQDDLINEEDRKKTDDDLLQILKRQTSDGDSNNKS